MTAPPADVVLTERVGRRGVLLIILGVLWMMVGVVVSEPKDRFSRPGPDSGPMHYMDEAPWFPLVWLAGGALAVVCALLRARLRRDDYGFNGLAIPPAASTLMYAASWSTHLVTGNYGRPTAWAPAVLFALATGLVLFLSGWSDMRDPHLIGPQ